MHISHWALRLVFTVTAIYIVIILQEVGFGNWGEFAISKLRNFIRKANVDEH